MVLDAEDGQPLVPQALEVWSLRLTWLSSTSPGSVVGIDGEAVVLGGDLDLAGPLVAHRVIGAAVAELELEGLAAEGLAQELVAQADAEDRDPASSAAVRIRRPQGSRSASSQGAGVARAVGEEDAVGLVVEDRLGRHGAGDDRHPAADLDQVAEDVPLHAEVERHDVRATGARPALRLASLPAVSGGARIELDTS